MKHIFKLLIIVIAILAGCESKPSIELTMEQAVYESLFLKITGNTQEKYYIVEVTENEWFQANPFNENEWSSSLDDLGGINIELIKTLYKNNNKSGSLNWNPFITNAQLLPPKYNVNANFSGSNCWVEESEANIDVTINNKSNRSYYTVSRVGFSKNNKNAIVKLSRHCAPMSGAGEFFIAFEFVEKQWKVIGGRTLWVS